MSRKLTPTKAVADPVRHYMNSVFSDRRPTGLRAHASRNSLHTSTTRVPWRGSPPDASVPVAEPAGHQVADH